MYYVHRWPILDPNGPPLADLKREATEDLRRIFRQEGLVRRGRIGWQVTNGTEPALTATVPVIVTGSTTLPVHEPDLIGAAA
ncbi:hypothetical protein [Nesterenkonia sp. K-15-9-6]|uniref:hypothetical protein n=1 Tax=Nesterenkonia sp. K-15-9-6 TaxID=3093918 RepID=UPI0040447B4D